MARSPLKPIDLERQLPALPNGAPPFKLSAGVGRNQPNKPGDVALVQFLLFRIGQKARRPGARPGDNFSGRIDGRWGPAAGRALGVVLRNDLAFAVLVKAGHRGPLAAPPTVTPDDRVAAGGKVFAHLVRLAKLEPAARRLTALPEMARPYLRAEAAALATVKASADRLKTLPDRLRPQYRRLLELGFKELGLLPVIAGHVAGTPGSGGGPSRASAGFWLDLADFRFIAPTGQVMRGLAALTTADHAARAALNKRLFAAGPARRPASAPAKRPGAPGAGLRVRHPRTAAGGIRKRHGGVFQAASSPTGDVSARGGGNFRSPSIQD